MIVYRSMRGKATVSEDKDKRSRKAFNCTSVRFKYPSNELPGPGLYHHEVPMAWVTESSSKKGYGPLISQAPRLHHEVEYTGPGPGEYTFLGGKKKKDFNHAPTTAVFRDKVPLTRPTDPHHQHDTTHLGPGAYSPMGLPKGTSLAWTTLPGARCAFQGPDRKCDLTGSHSVTPGPQEYNQHSSWTKARAHHAVRSPSPSAQPRRCTSAHISRRIGSVVFKKNWGLGGPPSPGPGAYNITQVASLEGDIRRAGTSLSAAFQPAIITDRFGSPPPEVLHHRATIPGPGAYLERHLNLIGRDAPYTTSAFRENHPGHDWEGAVLRGNCHPGPAYYSPSLALFTRQSHHVNSKRAAT